MLLPATRPKQPDFLLLFIRRIYLSSYSKRKPLHFFSSPSSSSSTRKRRKKKGATALLRLCTEMRRFRVRPPWQLPAALRFPPSRRLHASSTNSGDSAARQGKFLLPGASAAALLMLGVLHAKRMYDDKKLVERKEKGIEPEFSPDLKASFFRLLPLRSMSRLWGSLMEVEVPVFMRPVIYKAWARAFHSNLQESALPLEEYPSLQAFFIRSLKEGSRPIDPDPNCLVSPVDGKVLRLGQLRGPGTMIEQVKGFSYPVSSLLGASSSLHDTTEKDFSEEQTEENVSEGSNAKSWWRVSVASPKLRDRTRLSPKRGIFYCVLYLHPGDYHRVHSPVDWSISKRRHFSGNLFPTNERAVRTIRNLYVENERVVLEGQWKEGFVAVAAVGATNVGSIKLFIEPELRTNSSPGSRILQSQPPDERFYGPEGTGVMVKKGQEIAGFNMGSTVVLVFEAPLSKKAMEDGMPTSDFGFCVKAGDRIRVGEAIGRWS
ncbi:phosphatidylserine decarboxylase proenzyme 1, mitochondrial [Brachypodium distachyon]|nr:phosphatidylserine decarboxylase proenzyme 1, mitochondrial [Brachypodium distachyon]|eukprot:XP_003559037.3 phosphatidylserine decarboxylase proenzyme 1, mitochondrial [Brachypodium distachyon]